MAISPIQNRPATAILPAKIAASPRPQGLAKTPDRLEERPAEPPSFFKMLFSETIKFLLRCIFNFVDFLRRLSFETPAEPSRDRETFLSGLRTAPRPESLFLQFEQVYPFDEQTRVYRAIGEMHAAKISWKETFWERTAEENIALGRRLVRQNPFLLKDHLL